MERAPSGSPALLSAKGSGLLYISSAVHNYVKPPWFDGGLNPYTGSSGTRPQHTIAGLGAAIIPGFACHINHFVL